MHRKSFVVATIVAVLLVVSASAQAAKTARLGADQASRDNPVILVHGLNPVGGWGYPCPLNWGTMQDALRGWGWTSQPIDGVKYYAADTFCEGEIDHHGSHNRHYGNNKWWTRGFNHSLIPPNSHTSDTPIEHLGYHLAWYIYDHYTSQGKTVDLVGHSMGGLIIRYMLTMEEQHNADFPSTLRIGDVVTMETPHAGAWLSFFCGWSTQCQEMFPGSSFLNKLGSNPQGTGGTDWTAIGSYWDPLVDEETAVAMGAAHRLKYSYPIYDHLYPLFDTSESYDADYDHSESGGPWQQEYDGPHYLKEVDRALAGSDY